MAATEDVPLARYSQAAERRTSRIASPIVCPVAALNRNSAERREAPKSVATSAGVRPSQALSRMSSSALLTVAS